MRKPPVRVIVERHGPKLYMTVFSVGVQFFKIAEAEEREHCWFIGKMFLKALETAGLKPPRLLYSDMRRSLKAHALTGKPMRGKPRVSV